MSYSIHSESNAALMQSIFHKGIHDGAFPRISWAFKHTSQYGPCAVLVVDLEPFLVRTSGGTQAFTVGPVSGGSVGRTRID